MAAALRLSGSFLQPLPGTASPGTASSTPQGTPHSFFTGASRKAASPLIQLNFTVAPSKVTCCSAALEENKAELFECCRFLWLGDAIPEFSNSLLPYYILSASSQRQIMCFKLPARLIDSRSFLLILWGRFEDRKTFNKLIKHVVDFVPISICKLI